MPEWLIMYLAFSLAGGTTTYFTVIKEADCIYQEVTENKPRAGLIYFLLWNLASIFIAPLLALIVLTGKTDELKEKLLIGWIEDESCDDRPGDDGDDTR